MSNTDNEDLVQDAGPIETFDLGETRADDPKSFPSGAQPGTVTEVKIREVKGIKTIVITVRLEAHDSEGVFFEVTCWVPLKSAQPLSAASPDRGRIAEGQALLKTFVEAAGHKGSVTAAVIEDVFLGKKVTATIGQRNQGGYITLSCSRIKPAK